MCREPDGSAPDDDDVIFDNNNNGYLERAVDIKEIETIDPCLFYPENNKRINPITKEGCREGFSKYKKNKSVQNIYNFMVSLLLLYILYRFAFRHSK